MSKLLKGTYDLEKEIIDDEDKQKDNFVEKAINSIGGSMVFVEREKMIWNGDKKKNKQNNNKKSS